MRTVGIVSCGELGAALGAVFQANGMDVVTTSRDRSVRTCDLGRRSGARNLASFNDVVQASNLFVSVVATDAAESVANQYIEHATRGPNGLAFLDLNSVSPSTTMRIAERFATTGISYVDGALVGPASHLQTTSTVYLSGGNAREVADSFGPGIKTKVLSSHPGDASALKMLMGGMNKGIAALFFELALAAIRLEALPSFLAEYGANYPGVMALIERMAPTYARHARRRGQEMAEVNTMLRSLGLEPRVTGAARHTIDSIARLHLDADSDAKTTVEQISRRRDGMPPQLPRNTAHGSKYQPSEPCCGIKGITAPIDEDACDCLPTRGA